MRRETFSDVDLRGKTAYIRRKHAREKKRNTRSKINDLFVSFGPSEYRESKIRECK